MTDVSVLGAPERIESGRSAMPVQREGAGDVRSHAHAVRCARVFALVQASPLYSELYPEPVNEFCLSDLGERLALFLCAAVEVRMRTCLGREFREERADVRRVRGQIDMLRTERRQLLLQARVACRFQSLTTDTPVNRAVRSALHLLPGLCRGRATRLCRKHAAAMERMGVLGPEPTEADIRALQLRLARTRTPDARKDLRMLNSAYLALLLVRL